MKTKKNEKNHKPKLTKHQVIIYVDEYLNVFVKTQEGQFMSTNKWGLIYDESEVEVIDTKEKVK